MTKRTRTTLVTGSNFQYLGLKKCQQKLPETLPVICIGRGVTAIQQDKDNKIPSHIAKADSTNKI